jgi:ABC-type phosphate transport system auxiliary subunit
MDSILNKLTEIESAAVSIVQHAEAEKSILDEKYDEKRRQFDLELESETKKQIQAIQDDLQKKTSQILSSQSDESLAQINALQKEYEENLCMHRRFSERSQRCSLWDICLNTAGS